MSGITRIANFVRLAVMSGRAVFLAFVGGLMIGFAVWLVLPSGSSWFLDVIAACFVWKGLEVIGIGLEPFARKPDLQQITGPGRNLPSPYGSRGMQASEQGRSTRYAR
ncbi:hypothetical protein ACWAT4_37140 [Bradyrhizobium manausense]